LATEPRHSLPGQHKYRVLLLILSSRRTRNLLFPTAGAV
jgi:hypothetical protein